MTQKNERPTSQRNHPLRLGELLFLLVCLSLPVALYGVTGHPAFIVIFIFGLGSFGVYMASRYSKKEDCK